MVDIGTGYYVERTPKDAADYFKRKVDFVRANSEKVEKALDQKKNNMAGTS
jgi:prefoldin subunit 5